MSDVVEIVRSAIEVGRKISFDYTDKKGETTHRVVTPEEIEIGVDGGKLVVAVDEDKHQYRKFSVSRMEDVKFD